MMNETVVTLYRPVGQAEFELIRDSGFHQFPPRLPEQPIFQGNRIKVQYVRTCQPTFSGAFVAHVEATLSSDEEKNALCRPVQIPVEPIDWLRTLLASSQNRAAWQKNRIS